MGKKYWVESGFVGKLVGCRLICCMCIEWRFGLFYVLCVEFVVFILVWVCMNDCVCLFLLIVDLFGL